MTKGDATTITALEWVSEDLWSTLLLQGTKMRKCILKGGLGDWLCVMSVTIDGQPMVGFVGATTLPALLKKIVREVREETIRWRDDKFAK